jgi:hypothetical protein
MYKSFILLFLVLGFSCNPQPKNTTNLTTNLKQHVKELSSDLFQGRATATEGEILAAEYIIDQFKKYSLLPLGDRNGFIQEFPILENELDPYKSTVSVKGEFFKYGKDFIRIGGGGTFTAQELTSKVIVINGFSTKPNSAELKLIKDKIVYYNPPFNSAGHMSHESRKFMYEIAGYGPATILVRSNKSERRWQELFEKGGTKLKKNQEAAWPMWLDNKKETTHISFFEVSNRMAELLGIKKGDENTFEIIKLPLEISMDIKTRPSELLFGKNVIGYIKGTEKDMIQQPIILSAHYDGLGLLTINSDDRINNGADDNASGVAALLEIAQMFAKNNPKHPIIFIATSGEENGLWGSNYFINKFPSSFISPLANINLDMLGNDHREKGIFLIGQHELEKIEAIDQLPLEVHSDTDFEFDFPNEYMYYRSDHINFVEQNIPSVLFTSSGLPEYYHDTNDEYSVIDFDHLKYATLTVYKFVTKIDNLQIALKFKRPVEDIINDWHLLKRTKN